MKASDLIGTLQDLIWDHGDLDIVIPGGNDHDPYSAEPGVYQSEGIFVITAGEAVKEEE